MKMWVEVAGILAFTGSLVLTDFLYFTWLAVLVFIDYPGSYLGTLQKSDTVNRIYRFGARL